MGKKIYKAPEVQKILGISRKTLYNWICSGKIPKPRRDPMSFHRVWDEKELKELKRITGRVQS